MMELDELKSAWNSFKTPALSSEDIQKMLSENNHPVLKKIRKQLTIEITGWTIFLACYYTMFDGDNKPLWINVVLIVSILIPIMHSLMGYRFKRFFDHRLSLRDSLSNYVARVKNYAVISVITRQLYLAGFLLFFSYGSVFETANYSVMTVMGLIIFLQLLISCGIWIKRLKNLRQSLNSFS
jgi:hypothetical protein